MRDLASAYGLPIHRGGKISCPFHGDDRNPSMHIYDGDKGYYCFTCNQGGDVIDFIRKYEGIGFEDAVKRAAALAGIQLNDGSGLDLETQKRIRKLKDERDAKRREKEAHKTRIDRLADEIHCYEQFQQETQPLSDLWCVLQRLKEKAQAEWECAFQTLGKA